MHREKTKKVTINNIQIGGNNQVIIQSMTNTKTSNINETLKQINELFLLGCELVRVSLLDKEDCQALEQIIKKAPCPIIADIHYNFKFAINAIKSGVAKIRINPANIKNEQHLQEIVKCAKKHNVAIRLGFNTGSYENGISNENLIKQVIHYIKKFESWDFYNIVVSVKSADFKRTIELNKLLSQKIIYPIHLGVSEAGQIIDATIKSSIALYPLLANHIGNTIRISITGSPLQEVTIAKKILNLAGLYNKLPQIISCPTCGRLQWNIDSFIKKTESIINKVNKKITIAIMGCAVNGVGECKNADIGVYGNKTNCFLYKNGKMIKQVNHSKVIEEFEKLLFR